MNRSLALALAALLASSAPHAGTKSAVMRVRAVVPPIVKLDRHECGDTARVGDDGYLLKGICTLYITSNTAVVLEVIALTGGITSVGLVTPSGTVVLEPGASFTMRIPEGRFTLDIGYTATLDVRTASGVYQSPIYVMAQPEEV